MALAGIGCALTLGCAKETPQSSAQLIADSVYLNGSVYRVNQEQPWAEAFALDDGKFVAVGSSEEIKQYIGEQTEVVDLEQRFVMPGLQDTHMHTSWAAWFRVNLSMDPEQSWEALTKEIQDYAAAHPDRYWVFGGSLPWLTDTIGDGTGVAAHKTTLDKVLPDRPAVFFDIGGHAALANSLALELAGIDASTPDPVGGTIERDANGEPTGVLRELAGNMVTEVMDPVDQALYDQYMSEAMDKLHSYGITSITEVWADTPTATALQNLDNSGQLKMRVMLAMGSPLDFATDKMKKAQQGLIDNIDQYQGERLTTRYVKFVLDGSAGGQTMVMVDPYDGTDFRGHYRNERDDVIESVTDLHGKGIGSVIHAVGDGAIRTALDAVEHALKVHGDNGTRHSIAHTVFVNPEDMDRFAELGVNVEFSPYFWWPAEGLDVAERDIGNRIEWGFPAKTIMDKGNNVSLGSDWPVVFDPNPFPGIEALVTREVPGGSEKSYAKQHAITLDRAIKAFTLGGSYVNYAEETTGSIDPGKFADFIVLDRNLKHIPIREVHQAQVLTTVINGEVIFQR
jgi:predicted amidohydrolase YtcJ